MAQLFDRSCVAIVGDLRVTGLRMAFKVKKTTKTEPNTCELRIYNLAEKTRSRLQSKAIPVVLSAGYQDNAAIIFQGDARTIDHVRDNADWITLVRCGDGERAYQWAHFSESFAPGTPVADVIRAAAQALGVNTGNLDAELAKGDFRGRLTEFAHGYTAHGKASQELDKLLRTCGFSWSVQDGALQLLRGDAAAPGRAVLLTPETGLVGSPEHNAPDKTNRPPRVKFRSLLQPSIRCGGAVELRAAGVKGQFRVEALEHGGDTHGGEWYTNAEGLSL